MKKFLLPVLSLLSLSSFSQWQSTPITFQGQDCIAAFGKLFSSQVNFNNLSVSTDECTTFSASNTGLSAGVRFGVENAGTLYAFGSNNIYQTTTGNNWTAMTSVISSTDVVKAMTVMNGTVLALTNPASGINSKIYQLNGSSWALRSNFNNILYTTIENLNNTLYAGTTSTCVLISPDAGITFTNSSNGITPLTNFFDKYIVALGSTSSAIFCSTLGGRVFRSTDGGATWSLVYSIGNGTSTLGISDFYTTPNNSILTASDSGFVYSTNNGATGSWVKDNAGLVKVSGNYQTIKLALTQNYVVTADRDGKIKRKALSQLPLGIKQTEIVNVSTAMYPNPATDAVTFEISQAQVGIDYELIIKDILGKEVANYKVNDNKFNINLQQFNKGVYIYQLHKNANLLSSGKLIVN